MHKTPPHWPSETICRSFTLNGPLEFGFLIFIFRELLKHKRLSKLLPLLWGLFTCFSIVALLFIQGLDELPSVVRTTESFLVTFLALIFFVVLLRDMHIERLQHSSAFWFATGVLTYFSGSIFMFLFANQIQIGLSAFALIDLIWSIHGTLLILLYITYTIALLCKETTSTSSRAS